LPPVALEDDMIIEIWGLPARVHQALELVACHLRKYLVHRSVIPLFDPHVSCHYFEHLLFNEQLSIPTQYIFVLATFNSEE
jgi:poly(rC)-binding protein 2/3/4